jgi:hypothetical protein
MLSKLPLPFFYFLGAILALNLFQATCTDLLFDEAYYWYYAKNIAWGYFDHPPMVAWLIKISGFVFDGELGVRFMSCILSAATTILLWLTIDHEKKNEFIPHFFIVVFSMTLLNAYGFFTLPDTPLLFFTALFLFIYKKFIEGPSMVLAIILGMVMAALMYSKYHAVLVIFFVLLSNLKLLTNKYAWLAVIVALLCYVPHFNWLYEHDFVSINYHLFDRPNAAYDFKKYTGGFFVNLIALFGFTFPFVYWSLFKTKPLNLFTKALLYLTYGVILFFFISSFNRRVQTQWVIVISIPMAIMFFQYILENALVRKCMVGTGIVTIIALLVLRVGLIYEPLFPIKFETHGNNEWIDKIHYQAWDIPVVFENSYRNAPMYEFYSGRKAISLNNMSYRKNQYSIDDSEASLQGQMVLYISKYFNKKTTVAFQRSKKTVYYGKYIKDFETYRKLKCIIDHKEVEFDQNTEHVMKIYNPYDVTIPFEKLKFGMAYLNSHKEVREVKRIPLISLDSTRSFLKAKDTTAFKFKLRKTKLENPRYFRIGISENDLPYGLNGENIKIK